MIQLKAFFVGGLLLAVAGGAWATAGGVDANGCHDSVKIGFHCHPQRVKSGSVGGPGESESARDKRLRRECKGRPDGGACLGYGRR